MPRRAAIVNVPRSPVRPAPVPAPRRAYRRPHHELPGAFWSCPAPVDTDAYDTMFDRLVAG
jgi:hypothetical protein